MKHFIIILTVLTVQSSCIIYDGAWIACVGSSKSDFQNLSIYSDVNSFIGTVYFNLSKPTVLIFHGWQDKLVNNVSSNLIGDFLTRRSEFNILFGDWSAYSSDLNYANVVDKIPDIAQTFVLILGKLTSAGYNLSNFHIIGHSLGAHMSGRIGIYLQSQGIKISRITGLDPAGPLFVKAETISLFGMQVTLPGNIALSKEAAYFVDIIHSNAYETGTDLQLGHLDFWPNKGSIQPGCCGLLTDPVTCTTCNHYASFLFFGESVRSSKPIFAAKQCPSNILPAFYSSLTCIGPGTANMGFQASPTMTNGIYYLTTNSASPYSK